MVVLLDDNADVRQERGAFMRSGLVATLVGAGLSGLTGAAFAADANHINIQAVATETYDSNVARSDSTVAAIRGVSPADEIFEPSIEVDLLVPVSRQTLFLKGSAGYDFYAHNRLLNSGRVDLNGGVNARLRTCNATLASNILYQQTDLQDLSLVATRNLEDQESISLNGSCGGAVGLAPTFSVTQQWSHNSSSALVSSDFQETSLNGGLAYRRPRFGELSAFVSYDQTSFPNRDLLAGNFILEDGYKDYGVGVRYDRKLGAKIEGDVNVAFTWVRPKDPLLRGFQGVTYGADVTFRFSRLLRAKLSLARAVNPTIQPDVTYAIDNKYGGELDYSLGRKLNLVAGASGENDNYNGAAVRTLQDITHETVWDVYASAHYQLNRRIGFGLDLRHERRDANLSEFSYSDTRIGLSIMGSI